MLTYPPLPYRAAVDWSISSILASPDAIAPNDAIGFLAGDEFATIEFLKRLRHRQVLYSPLGELQERIQGGQEPPSLEICWENVQVDRIRSSSNSLQVGNSPFSTSAQVAIWAGIPSQNQQEAFEITNKILDTSGTLWIMQPGWLSFLVQDQRYQPYPIAEAARNMHLTKKLLSDNGYRVVQRVGFFGLKSLFYSFVAGQWDRLQQPNLVERYQHRTRDLMRVTGKRAALASISLVAAVRGAK